MKLPLALFAAAVVGAFGICDICRPAAQAQIPERSGMPVIAASMIAPPVIAPTPATLDTVVLHVEGMTCGGCTMATRKVLERLAGVTKAEVSYAQKRAVVSYDRREVTIAQMIAAVATLNYTATVVPATSRS